MFRGFLLQNINKRNARMQNLLNLFQIGALFRWPTFIQQSLFREHKISGSEKVLCRLRMKKHFIGICLHKSLLYFQQRIWK